MPAGGAAGIDGLFGGLERHALLLKVVHDVLKVLQWNERADLSGLR